MNQEMESRTVPREDEIDLTELFRALSRRRRLILGITAASAAVALVVSLLLPVYYKAETRILPPQEKGSNLAAQLMGQAGGLIALAGGAAGVKSQGELFVAMTKSRTVLDRMVDRFDLMKLYKKKYRQDARKKLLELLTVQEDRKSGIIILTVEDRDPKRAADMANAFVEELKSLAGGLAISEAGQRRMFFEDQTPADEGVACPRRGGGQGVPAADGDVPGRRPGESHHRGDRAPSGGHRGEGGRGQGPALVRDRPEPRPAAGRGGDPGPPQSNWRKSRHPRGTVSTRSCPRGGSPRWGRNTSGN